MRTALLIGRGCSGATSENGTRSSPAPANRLASQAESTLRTYRPADPNLGFTTRARIHKYPPCVLPPSGLNQRTRGIFVAERRTLRSPTCFLCQFFRNDPGLPVVLSCIQNVSESASGIRSIDRQASRQTSPLSNEGINPEQEDEAAEFHGDCMSVVAQHLGVSFSPVTEVLYATDGDDCRAVCLNRTGIVGG